MFEIFDYELAHKRYELDADITSFLSNQYCYIPEKFGRSTLRQIDYLKRTPNYNHIIYRNQILFFFADKQTHISLSGQKFIIHPHQLTQIHVIQNTELNIQDTAENLWIFAIDTWQDIQETNIEPNIESFGDTQTHVQLLELSNNQTHNFNQDNKPFYAHILLGCVDASTDKITTMISEKSGFYATQETSITAQRTSKILTFLMPIPL